jgi:uncharacterized membrane protein YqgA involved in biofilm formation
MVIGLGTIINASTIIIGASVGVLMGSRFTEKTRNLITNLLGTVTLLAAADALKTLWNSHYSAALPKGWGLLVLLGSLLLGTLIGLAIGFEELLDRFGATLKARFAKGSDSAFIEGFVSASLLFVIGPMAIMGAISDGMGMGNQQLILKSILDGITAIAFAASLGWGVAFSALPVGIYQGLWTLAGLFLGSVLPAYQVQAMTITGGILLLAISLRLLDIKSLPVGDILPALFLAPALAAAAHQFI